MRMGQNEIIDDKVYNGFDYEHQAWVMNGKYVKCGHPDSMECGCYGKDHEGEDCNNY